MKKKLILIVIILNIFMISTINAQLNFNDSLITTVLSEINQDSIEKTIQTLQDFDTRYALSPKRLDIAKWIKNKFISFGYNNAKIDSFKTKYNTQDSVWQYNIIASLNSSLNPNNIVVVGAHYDSTSDNRTIYAPGADDNASGVAAIIEVARVLKKNNYKPVSTIQYVAFAYEEGPCAGSQYYIKKTEAQNKKIDFMINNDMIANTLSNDNWTVTFQNYDNSGWLTSMASLITKKYTILNSIESTSWLSGSDSWSFYQKGYSVIYLTETDFSPHWHKTTDIISNCNIPYCTEVTKITCGILLLNHTPTTKLNADFVKDRIEVRWDKINLPGIKAYNLYKSNYPDRNFVKINANFSLDTSFIDSEISDSIYYYTVTVLDSNLVEVIICKCDSVIICHHNKGILIVDDSRNEFLYPSDSIVDVFYNKLLSDYPSTQSDLEYGTNLYLSRIGQYNMILWHTDKYTTYSKFNTYKNLLSQYLQTGGKLIFTTDKFLATTEQMYNTHFSYQPNNVIYDFFKIESIYRDYDSRFIGAKPTNSIYPSLYIDTLKTPPSNTHHLRNIDAIFNLDSANVIYTYNSMYDSTSTFGKMKGQPVGIEYSNDNYKVITLSFPLWYINYKDAKAFIDYVIPNLLSDSKEEKNPDDAKFVLQITKIYPNPSNSDIDIEYFLPQKSHINISLLDINGRVVSIATNEVQDNGKHVINLKKQNLQTGIYFCRFSTNYSIKTKKIIFIN